MKENRKETKKIDGMNEIPRKISFETAKQAETACGICGSGRKREEIKSRVWVGDGGGIHDGQRPNHKLHLHYRLREHSLAMGKTRRDERVFPSIYLLLFEFN